MFKNTASQKITFLVIDTATNVPKTGDAANLTAYVSIDDGAVTALTDTSATELSSTNAPGLYTFDCTQAETNGDKLLFSGKSSTSGVRVVPVMVYTLPASFTSLNVSDVNTLASHDPGATLGTSTLTQAQVTGGAYALNSASFSFNAALDFTTTQKAATIARVTLTDTVTTYTGNTPQTGDSFARIGATGGGLTSLAPAATALSSATWTPTRAGYLDNLSGGAVALASGVTVTSIGAGAITASSIAADAIGASELASDAVSEIAAAVWDLTTTGHTTGGTFGAAMNAAGSAGDPWSTALPGAYSAGTAGYLVGTNLNTTVSSRLASASYTAPLDASGTRSAVGLAAANLDTQLASIQSDTTTLLSRVTSTLFSGITSLGQWLGLLAGKQTANSTARTEIRATGAGSGTYDETTDSQEATVDRGNAAWVTGSGGGGGGTGSGAYTLTITVDDGTDPLQNASVRLTEGVTDLIGTTDVNGEVVFSVDAATWAVAITKDGYQFTPTALAVSASDSVTYSMTQVSITPNPDADKSTVVVTCYGADTEVEPGATLYVRQITAPSGDEDHAYSGAEIEYTADGDGVVTLTLWAGAKYEVHRGDKRWLQTITPAAGTDSLSSFVGRSS